MTRAGIGWFNPVTLVASVFAQYRVVAFYSDVAMFETYVDRWSADVWARFGR